MKWGEGKQMGWGKGGKMEVLDVYIGEMHWEFKIYIWNMELKQYTACK